MIFKNGGKNLKKQGESQEKKLAKKLGMKIQSGSGAPWHCKGDLRGAFILCESKNTNKNSISVKLSWLEKIEHEANRIGRIPLLIIGFGEKYYKISKLEE